MWVSNPERLAREDIPKYYPHSSCVRRLACRPATSFHTHWGHVSPQVCIVDTGIACPPVPQADPVDLAPP